MVRACVRAIADRPPSRLRLSVHAQLFMHTIDCPILQRSAFTYLLSLEIQLVVVNHPLNIVCLYASIPFRSDVSHPLCFVNSAVATDL